MSILMGWAVASAGPLWSDADLAGCESGDATACRRLLNGEVREVVQGGVTGAFIDHLSIACDAGVTWACAGMRSSYEPACGEACPPAVRSPADFLPLEHWVPAFGSAVAFDGDTIWGPNGSQLTPQLRRIHDVGEAAGAFWVVIGNQWTDTPVTEMVRLGPEGGGERVSITDLPSDGAFPRRFFWGGDTVGTCVAGGPIAQTVRMAHCGLIGLDGRFERLNPPASGAVLVGLAGGARVWTTDTKVYRQVNGAQVEQIVRLPKEKFKSVADTGEVILLGDSLRLWTGRETRVLEAAGRPVGATWSTDQKRILVTWASSWGHIAPEGHVLERHWTRAPMNVRDDLVPLEGGGLRLEEWLHGTPEPVPDWLITGLAALGKWVEGPPDPDRPDGATEIRKTQGADYAFGPNALYIEDENGAWQRTQLVPVEVRDQHGRRVTGQRFQLLHPPSLVLPWPSQDLRIPDPKTQGAAQRPDGSWLLTLEAPTPVDVEPLTGPARGVFAAANEGRRRTELQPVTADNTLEVDGRWLVLSRGPHKKEPFRLAYRVSPDVIWMMQTYDNEAFVFNLRRRR